MPRPARSPLALDAPAPEGVRRVALALLGAARTAAARLRAPADPDALHDFRVALRRLRSWLRAFRPELRDTLRKKRVRRIARLAASTGAARDAEAQAAQVASLRAALPARHRAAADWLAARLAARAPAGGGDPRARAAARFEHPDPEHPDPE